MVFKTDKFFKTDNLIIRIIAVSFANHFLQRFLHKQRENICLQKS